MMFRTPLPVDPLRVAGLDGGAAEIVLRHEPHLRDEVGTDRVVTGVCNDVLLGEHQAPDSEAVALDARWIEGACQQHFSFQRRTEPEVSVETREPAEIGIAALVAGDDGADAAVGEQVALDPHHAVIRRRRSHGGPAGQRQVGALGLHVHHAH